MSCICKNRRPTAGTGGWGGQHGGCWDRGSQGESLPRQPAHPSSVAKPCTGHHQQPGPGKGPLICSLQAQGDIMRSGRGLSPWQGRQDGVEMCWGRYRLLCPWGRCFCQLWAQLGPAAVLHCAQAQLPPGRAGAAHRSVRAQRSGAAEGASSSRGSPGAAAPPAPELARESRALLWAFPCLTSVRTGHRSTACRLHSPAPACSPPSCGSAAPRRASPRPHTEHLYSPLQSTPVASHRAPPQPRAGHPHSRRCLLQAHTAPRPVPCQSGCAACPHQPHHEVRASLAVADAEAPQESG